MVLPVLHIPHSPWMTLPETRAVMDALGTDEARFVGGCVRNVLLGEPVGDIDIATRHRPEAVLEHLKKAGIRAIPTGIAHGTVTAVTEGRSFEITTLRRDTETDGRHARVIYTDDWAEDAQRRDFTMNALFMDVQGGIYDPTENGLSDLRVRRVAFVGDPARRVAEDYLRILRFFRFHAQYGQGEPDPEGLRACREAAQNLSTLSKERITQEFLKILATNASAKTFVRMFENGVLADLRSPSFCADRLDRCVKTRPDGLTFGIPARLVLFSGESPEFFAVLEQHLRFSGTIRKETNGLFDALSSLGAVPDTESVQRTLYRCGREATVQALLIGEGPESCLAKALNTDIPVFPVRGQDLIDAGGMPGPALGDILRETEGWWMDRLFSPSRKECLEMARSLIEERARN